MTPCPRCNSEHTRHRTAVDPSGAELPALECVDCESLCLLTPIALVQELQRFKTQLERADARLSEILGRPEDREGS